MKEAPGNDGIERYPSMSSSEVSKIMDDYEEWKDRPEEDLNQWQRMTRVHKFLIDWEVRKMVAAVTAPVVKS